MVISEPPVSPVSPVSPPGTGVGTGAGSSATNSQLPTTVSIYLELPFTWTDVRLPLSGFRTEAVVQPVKCQRPPSTSMSSYASSQVTPFWNASTVSFCLTLSGGSGIPSGSASSGSVLVNP